MIKNSFLSLATIAVILGCSTTPLQTSQYVGGSGTETVGITGTIVDSNFVGVSNVAISMHRSDFLDTSAESASHKSSMYTAGLFTNDSGKFTIGPIDTGEYTIEARDKNHHAILMNCRVIRPDTLIVFPKQMLLPTATVSGVIPQVPDAGSTRVSVHFYGIFSRSQTTTSDGKFTIIDVPKGSYRYKIIPHTPLYMSIDTMKITVDAGTYGELGTIKMPQATLAINPRDSVIVRAILDSNGLFAMRTDQVATVSGWPFRVTAFKLTDPGMTTLTSHIGELSELRTIDVHTEVRGTIRGNGIKRIPREIGKLDHLKILNVSNNTIDSLPQEIGDLDSLENFNVAGNVLTSLPREIGMLHRLKTFSVSNNQIDSLPHEIGNFDSLESFTIANNTLTSLPSELGKLKSLVTFVADHNQLSSVPQELANCNSLRNLYLGNNLLTAIPQIGPLDRYNYIGIENNSITHFPSDVISSHAHGNFINVDGNMMCSDTAMLPDVENWLNNNSYNHQGWQSTQCRPNVPEFPKGNRDPGH